MNSGKAILEAMRIENNTHRSIGNACWETLEAIAPYNDLNELEFMREYFLQWRDCYKTRIAAYIKMINAAAAYYPGIFKGTQALAEVSRLAAVSTTRVRRSRNRANSK